MKYLKFWNESFEIPVHLKVEIEYPKIAENRQSSFWYYDKTIATVSDGFHTFEIRASGEIDVCIGDGSYENNDAVNKAKELNFTDDDLNVLGASDNFNRNNWFLVEYYNEKENKEVEISIDPIDYDDAIETAKHAFNEPYIMDKVSNICDCHDCKKRKKFKQFDL